MSSDLDEGIYMRILSDKGGCRCTDPGAHPPCGNCTTEAHWAEALSALESLAGTSACTETMITSVFQYVKGIAPMARILELQAALIEDYDYEARLE